MELCFAFSAVSTPISAWHWRAANLMACSKDMGWVPLIIASFNCNRWKKIEKGHLLGDFRQYGKNSGKKHVAIKRKTLWCLSVLKNGHSCRWDAQNRRQETATQSENHNIIAKGSTDKAQPRTCAQYRGAIVLYKQPVRTTLKNVKPNTICLDKNATLS